MRLDLVGIGLTIVLAAVSLFFVSPPSWWPKMSITTSHVGLIIISCLLAVGIIITISGILQNILNYKTTTFFVGIAFCAIICAIYTYIWSNVEIDPFPHVLVSWGYGQIGPYSVNVINSNRNGDPMLNVSMSIRRAGSFDDDSAFIKIGDIEPGISIIPGAPKLDVGWYQINIRYRGGFVMQMLQMQFSNGHLLQKSLFYDAMGKDLAPQFQKENIPPQTFSGKISDIKTGPLESVDVSAPTGKDGLHLDSAFINLRSVSGEKEKVAFLRAYVTVGDEVIAVIEGGKTYDDVDSASGRGYDLPIRKLVKVEDVISIKVESVSNIAGHSTNYEQKISFNTEKDKNGVFVLTQNTLH